jgi:regulator of protease activity HflC (stomatin/prohibitin superfamily)
MPSFLQVAIFIVLEVIVLAIMPPVGVVAGTVVALLVASAAKVANQWQHAIVLRVGKFHGVRGPGLFWIIPIVDRVRMIDTRILAHHIPRQEVITRDNVPVAIDSVLFYRVTNAEDAVLKIQDFSFAVAQLA